MCVCVSVQRLSTANDEIVEVLLSKQHVLGALRFIRSVGGHDNISARKFLDAARQTDDGMLFYTIFRFFEQRNLRLRGSPNFNPGQTQISAPTLTLVRRSYTTPTLTLVRPSDTASTLTLVRPNYTAPILTLIRPSYKARTLNCLTHPDLCCDWSVGEHCEEHVSFFKQMFGEQALMKPATV